MSYEAWTTRNANSRRAPVDYSNRVERLGAAILVTSLLVGMPAARAAALSTVPASTSKLDPGIDASPTEVSVILQAWPGRAAEAAAAVKAQGGMVGLLLPVLDGLQAKIAATALPALAASPSVKAITADREGQFEHTRAQAPSTTTSSDFISASGATAAWVAGDLGEGVGVAVIDTGVSNTNDLSARISWAPDLSGEHSTVDSFGHGTVMAGLIAGSGADSAANPTSRHSGVAPRANLVAVKVAGYNGAVGVSTILQAMNWVAANQQRFNIRVLNLSWSTASTQSPVIDPLNYAVERLWRQGIVVVVAAGNGGPSRTSIAKPGDDPMVLTVGAYDDHNRTIPSWSSRGPTAAGAAKPDVVAPGRTLIATRSYGSNVEVNNATALVSPSYIKGSGTSEAAAVTSGLVALLLAAHPTYTPDQVKAVLSRTASPIRGYQANDQGAGRVQLAPALTADPGQPYWQSGPAPVETVAPCRGGDPSRLDPRDPPWLGSSWSGSSWPGSSWSGSSWSGSSWSGSSWSGSSWSGSSWSGSSWSGSSWSGSSWSGSSWSDASWATDQSTKPLAAVSRDAPS